MDKDDWKALCVVVCVTVVVFVMCILSWIGQSYMEARSYNSVTGKNVSTWDAMWIELRIQEPVK